MQNKNSFNKLQTPLQKQGWYVAWDDDQVSPPSTHPFGPFKGQAIDPVGAQRHGLRSVHANYIERIKTGFADKVTIFKKCLKENVH